MSKLVLYMKLARLDRPIGILLLLWPTLWGLWIAGDGEPDGRVLLIFLLGTVLMRSAGCVINDYADRHFDKHVKRTQERPITSGLVAPREALWLAAGLSIAALMLVLQLNWLTFWLSIPALFLAGSYPFTKRFLVIPQAYLGIAFGFGIPMGFAAQNGNIPNVAWVLVLANILWCVAYDTEYAMVDRDDDTHLGINSSALLFGQYDVLAIMICYLGALIAMMIAGVLLNMGMSYYLGLTIAGLVAVYHYGLIRSRERTNCFRAFLHNNWFGAAIFVGIFMDYLLRSANS